MNTKKIYLILFFIVAVFGGIYFYNKYRIAPDIQLPSLHLKDSEGEPFDINSIKNRKTIICFYASWCGDCIQELNVIHSIKPEKLSDIDVVAITDEPPEKLISFKIKKGYPFTFLRSEQPFNDLKIFSIPVVYLMNSKGEIVYNHVGYIDWKDESTLNHLKALMN